MIKFNPNDIVKVSGKDIVGRVLGTFATTTKIMTKDGERTFPNLMLEQIVAYNAKNLVIHPEQLLLRGYYAECEAKNPVVAKFFRLMAEELFAMAGWYPGDASWHFTKKAEGGSDLAIRLPAGKTSNLFHLSCHGDAIRIELEPSKKLPPGLGIYFPKNAEYTGKNRKDISGTELEEKRIREYIGVLKTFYKHNIDLKNKPKGAVPK